MTTSPPPDLLTTSPPDPDRIDGPDVPRRTWLAAERTWLAWWRTGLVLPGLTGGARWPYVVLGLGYGVLAVAVLVVGAVRQQRVAKALHRDSYDELSAPLVMWLTVAAVALSTITLTVIVVSV
jgi:uncharacterized membrane protein YidH (DUF202 family)